MVSLSPYKVTDANLAAQYTFAQQAAVLALSSTISTATFQSLLSASHDTKLQKYDATNHTLADSALSESSTAVVSTKKITATAFEGNCAGCTGLTGATGGVANTGSTTIGGDTDGDGVGVIDEQINHVTYRRLNNDGTTDFYAAARINGQAIVTTDDQRLSDAATLRNGVIDRGTSVRAFGDSQTAITTWLTQLCALKHWSPCTNSAVSGAMAADYWSQIYPVNVSATANQQFVMLSLFNDAHIYGADQTYKDYSSRALMASLLWLTIPDAQKIRSTDLTRWSYTGTWTTNASALYGGITSYNRYTSSSGATGQIIFTGGRVLALGVTAIEPTGGTFNVTIDGTTYGPFSCQSPVGGSSGTGSAVTANGQSYGPQAFYFAGLPDKSHTLTVTTVTADGSHLVYVDWAASTAGARSTGGPNLIVGGVIKPKAALFSSGGVVSTSASETVDLQYDQIARDDCNLVASWGLPCTFADVRSPIDPVNDIRVDNIHLNTTTGDAKTVVSMAAAATAGAIGPPPTGQFVSPSLYTTAGVPFLNPHRVAGAVTLSGGTATVTLTGAAAFTSYACTATDQTSAAAVKVSLTDGSHFTLTGTGSDSVAFICEGN